jgi:hypothetical protein
LKHALQSGLTVINGGSETQAMYRKAILCKTGKWDGANGEVEVTVDLLQGLADNYNAERANALNKNDYAPILVDHNRQVDLVKGRLDTSRMPLTIEKLSDGSFGLIGELRIDNQWAQQCVDDGTYAQLSLSFDDEKMEIYEVSFVAVEAARRSQVLSKGDKKMGKKSKLVALSLVNSVVASNREVSLGIVKGVKTTSAGVTSLKAELANVQTAIKTAGLKSLFHGLMREGKMSKAEFSKINLKTLSALDTTAIKAVTDAYTGRKPSSDIVQFGQSGAKPKHSELSSAEFRKLRDQQLAAGKKGVKNLEAGEDKKDEDKEGKKEDLSSDKDTSESLGQDDVSDLEAMLTKCLEALKPLSESLESIQSYAKKLQVDDKKEEELASGDDESDEDEKDSKDMSAEDDKDENEKDKNNGEGKGE